MPGAAVACGINPADRSDPVLGGQPKYGAACGVASRTMTSSEPAVASTNRAGTSGRTQEGKALLAAATTARASMPRTAGSPDRARAAWVWRVANTWPAVMGQRMGWGR